MIYVGCTNLAVAYLQGFSYLHILLAVNMTGIFHKHAAFIARQRYKMILQGRQPFQCIPPPSSQRSFAADNPFSFVRTKPELGTIMDGNFMIQCQQTFQVVRIKCRQPLSGYC